jgi:hypothetical protein
MYYASKLTLISIISKIKIIFIDMSPFFKNAILVNTENVNFEKTNC